MDSHPIPKEYILPSFSATEAGDEQTFNSTMKGALNTVELYEVDLDTGPCSALKPRIPVTNSC